MPESIAIRPTVQERGTNFVMRPLPGGISVVVSGPRFEIPSSDARAEAEAIEAIDTIVASGKSGNAVPSESAIQQQLTRVLQSSIFIHSDRLSRFLRFIVEHVLRGNQDCLKEYVIGSEVYDRRPPYHPGQDSIVRTEARRLRGKLKEYYTTEGKDDPVSIELRPGSYIPAFRRNELASTAGSIADTNHHVPLIRISGPAVAVLPFHDISRTTLSSTYARGIPDELAYTLMQTEGCRVISPASMAQFSAAERDATAAMRKAGAQIAYEGSVREESNHIRVTASIIDERGFQLWTERFDTEAGSHPLFTIEGQIASVLSAGFEVLFGHPRLRNAI